MWDFRKGHPRFAGIVLQEYDHAQRRLIGPMTNILSKKELTEGPNIYKRDGWYYLMLAEGGTGWNHGISMARSRTITGPYEVDPQHSVLTARDDPSLALQKAGHGELVQTPAGEWYLAHLASRPLGTADQRRCILGRETCIQKVTWSDDGWLRLAQGGWHPRVEVSGPDGLAPIPWPAPPSRDEFDAQALDPSWSSLRTPVDDSWLTLRDRPGWLRLRGRESLHSLFHQSLVAKRLTEFRAIAETCIDFRPTHFTQMAGLVCYYDTRTHYYLRVTNDEARGTVLGITLTDDSAYDEIPGMEINDWRRVFLRAEINRERLQFSASPDGAAWTEDRSHPRRQQAFG